MKPGALTFITEAITAKVRFYSSVEAFSGLY